MFGGGAVGLLYLIIKVSSVRLTDVGISQISLRGRVHLNWDGIRSVRFNPGGFSLVGTSGRILIFLPLYRQVDDSAAWLLSRVPDPPATNDQRRVAANEKKLDDARFLGVTFLVVLVPAVVAAVWYLRDYRATPVDKWPTEPWLGLGLLVASPYVAFRAWQQASAVSPGDCGFQPIDLVVAGIACLLVAVVMMVKGDQNFHSVGEMIFVLGFLVVPGIWSIGSGIVRMSRKHRRRNG